MKIIYRLKLPLFLLTNVLQGVILSMSSLKQSLRFSTDRTPPSLNERTFLTDNLVLILGVKSLLNSGLALTIFDLTEYQTLCIL